MKPPVLSTFSVVAADPETHEIGIAVQSKFLSVGAVVPWVRAGVGAIATQAFPNVSYGPLALELMQSGSSPQETLRSLLERDTGADDSPYGNAEDRQYGLVDPSGRSATFTGKHCIEWAGGIAEEGFAAQGNCLASARVVEALAASMRSSKGHLADRLVAALRAGQAEGGDKRGKQSAALIIEKPGGGYCSFNDRYVDLRVDDHPEPIEELARILELHKLYYFSALPDEVLPIDEALGGEIVRALHVVRPHDVSFDVFDDKAHAALLNFMREENLENRIRHDKTIDLQTLRYLRDTATRGAIDIVKTTS